VRDGIDAREERNWDHKLKARSTEKEKKLLIFTHIGTIGGIRITEGGLKIWPKRAYLSWKAISKKKRIKKRKPWEFPVNVEGPQIVLHQLAQRQGGMTAFHHGTRLQKQKKDWVKRCVIPGERGSSTKREMVHKEDQGPSRAFNQDFTGAKRKEKREI